MGKQLKPSRASDAKGKKVQRLHLRPSWLTPPVHSSKGPLLGKMTSHMSPEPMSRLYHLLISPTSFSTSPNREHRSHYIPDTGEPCVRNQVCNFTLTSRN